MNSAFEVDNLLASQFINASGKVIKLSLESLHDSTPGILFSRFYFRIDPTQKDACIQRDLFCFQFSLRFLQNHFYTITNKVEYISSP